MYVLNSNSRGIVPRLPSVLSLGTKAHHLQCPVQALFWASTSVPPRKVAGISSRRGWNTARPPLPPTGVSSFV